MLDSANSRTTAYRRNNDNCLKMHEISCLNPQHSTADNLKSLTATQEESS